MAANLPQSDLDVRSTHGKIGVVKNDSNIQWKDIHIMVTPEQKAIIDRKADEAGLPVAAFLRTLALLHHLEVVPNADDTDYSLPG